LNIFICFTLIKTNEIILDKFEFKFTSQWQWRKQKRQRDACQIISRDNKLL